MPPDQNHYGNNQQGNATPASTGDAAPTGSFLSRLFGNQSSQQQSTAQQGNQLVVDPTKSQQQEQQVEQPSYDDLLTRFFSQDPVKKEVDPNAPPAVDHFAVDAKSLTEKFGGLNVAQYIPKEKITAALAGDADAFMEVLNQASSISAMAAFRTAMDTSKAGVTSSLSNLESLLPDKFREQQRDYTLENHPDYSTPIMKPMIAALKNEVLSRYPKATDKDILEVADKMFGGKSNKANQSNPSQSQSQGTDWDTLFGEVTRR